MYAFILARKKWPRKASLMLIELYRQKKADFMGSTLRNDEVWIKLAACLKNDGHDFSGTQCQNKFKALKKGYAEKLFNMSTKASGAGRINFEFFNEMDEIFEKDPSFRPLTTADSGVGFNPGAGTDTTSPTTNTTSPTTDLLRSPQKKKKKLTASGLILERLDKIDRRREQRDIKRDEKEEKRLQQQKESSDQFNQLMTKMIEKL